MIIKRKNYRKEKYVQNRTSNITYKKVKHRQNAELPLLCKKMQISRKYRKYNNISKRKVT